MKIKKQFRLLILGIAVIPVVAFILDAVYIREISGMSHSALMRFLPFAALLIMLLFSVIMSLFIVRSITLSITALEDSTRRIANGDLDLVVDVGGNNEIASLSNSLNKMRSALKEEGKRRYFFVMGITHDLKTPLALIKANVEAIEDGISARPEEKKHSLAIINNKVDELEGMINSILDFVRTDSAETRNVRVTNLQSFLSSYSERVAVDAELLHHNVESTINIPASIAIGMDSLLIQRALDNIVNNSFRYTPKGTCLSIAAELDGPVILLTISDNGGGIHEKDLPYIFDHFYRGSTSRGEQGMGMGLTVTKSIIDSHGWSISAASSAEGAAFTITIPL